MSRLVLNVKEFESVYIGDNIVVTLVEARGKGFRIAFDVPSDIPVLREAVLMRLQNEQRQKQLREQLAETTETKGQESGNGNNQPNRQSREPESERTERTQLSRQASATQG